MKHFFKGPLDNLIYIGKSKYNLPHTFSIDVISDKDYKKIKDGHTITVEKNSLLIIDDNDVTKEEKKLKCRELILEKYKLHDQTNILMDGSDTQKKEMKIYISSLLMEYRSNGKDANFSKITL